MQELRGNKKLVYFSAINADKGSTDYFRYKRLVEDNANLLKNSLIIRPSTMFGPGDKFNQCGKVRVYFFNLTVNIKCNLPKVGMNLLVGPQFYEIC